VDIWSPSILVVDDDPDFRDWLAAGLEAHGYGVAAVSNGTEALVYLARTHAIRVIILDLVMPVMNGFQFLMQHSQDERLRRIPVIVVTGEPETEQVVFSMSARFQKPVELPQLLPEVSRWCGRSRRRPSGIIARSQLGMDPDTPTGRAVPDVPQERSSRSG
jgi:CheY-like chemotaxis protein